MRSSLYPRLAWDGLRKNRQLAQPYLLTCMGMVAMHYILAFLASPAVLRALPSGRETIETVMGFGCAVALLFSLVFLFYTHSFLDRRRAKEFGLYSALGMGKGNLARIALWEGLITAALALSGGLALGALFSKLAELGLVNMMGGEINYRLGIDARAMLRTVAGYVPIFGLNGLVSAIRVRRCSAASLLKAENMGEKPPRGNRLLAGLGALILGAAYWLAASIKNPIDALGAFFAAVLMVIAATYMLMIAGSVWLCRRLQRNKRYYYRPAHFVSVSSMAYRMKRNGAGLASICVIATMVLVMLSTTACLWLGTEDAVQGFAPREINVKAVLDGAEQLGDANLDILRDAIGECAAENGVTPSGALDCRYIYLTGVLNGGELQCDYEAANSLNARGDLREVFVVPASDYNARTGEPMALGAGEAALLVDRCGYSQDRLTLAMGEAANSFQIVSVDSGEMEGGGAATLPGMTLIVGDLDAAIEGFPQTDSRGRHTLAFQWKYGFDTGLDDGANLEFQRALSLRLEGLPRDGATGPGWRSVSVSSRAGDAADFRATYGSLFFIGAVLSAVFLAAAVLILYYKQVSEGYEDARRFEIMRKVGMTRREIRGSVASQLRTVFMLPLGLAGLHLAFAFPMIRRLLTLLGLQNTGLFAHTTLASFAAFAAFYWAAYRLTSGVYCRIVGGTGGELP